MNRIKKISKFISLTAKYLEIITIFLAIVLFMTGMKNIDFAHNMELINTEHNLDYYDEGINLITGEKITHDFTEWYMLGMYQTFLSFFLLSAFLLVFFLENIFLEQKVKNNET